MRMWMVDPELLCRKHLMGEHVETHMFLGTINKGVSLQGYVDNKLVSTPHLKSRHDELADEMIRRGYNHNSPLEYTDTLNLVSVDVAANIEELKRRCPDCRARILERENL